MTLHPPDAYLDELSAYGSPATRWLIHEHYGAHARGECARPELRGPISTRSTNLCQDGEHQRCPLGSQSTGWRGPFRCRCLCHQAANADAGRTPDGIVYAGRDAFEQGLRDLIGGER